MKAIELMSGISVDGIDTVVIDIFEPVQDNGTVQGCARKDYSWKPV